MANSKATGTKSTGTRGGGKRKSAAAPTKASVEELQQYYRDMLLIRRFEEKAGQMYGMGLIGGFCHLYIGQEAVVVGIQAAMGPKDTVLTSYRDHAHMLACGMDSKGVMAELTGREGGYSKGKGGSMHMFSHDKRFYGGHGIVGAQVPLGTGFAFAHRYLDEDAVSVTYLGDGALNQGQVYESFNMAALWSLPAVYVIENNKYGMGTSIERSSAKSTELYNRGQAYGIPGVQVDGMDVLAVREAAEKALGHARSGKGPYIMEMLTYRYRGHSMSDPQKYRTKEELEAKKDEDPILRVKKYILDHELSDIEALDAMDEEVKEEVRAAVEFAEQSEFPPVETMYEDVYTQDDYPFLA